MAKNRKPGLKLQSGYMPRRDVLKITNEVCIVLNEAFQRRADREAAAAMQQRDEPPTAAELFFRAERLMQEIEARKAKLDDAFNRLGRMGAFGPAEVAKAVEANI